MTAETSVVTSSDHSYTIRPVRRAELPKLPRIEQAAGRLFAGTAHAWIDGDEGMGLASFEHWFVHGQIWVAADEADEPVGFAVAHELDGNAYLHELDVDPAHGRRGLGTRLIEAVTVWAQENGYPAVTLATCVDIPWNAPYYTRLGFRALREDELAPGLQAVRTHEIEAGWAPADRVCMIRPVPPL
ncbi:MAG: GNAT family N-acetyltransferase [Caldilineaceae bacterium]